MKLQPGLTKENCFDELMQKPKIIDRKKYRWIIGIDPGVNTGVSMWDRKEKKLRQVGSMSIHKAMDTLNALCEWEVIDPEGNDDKTLVRIEDARLRKWIPRERDIKQVVGRAKGAGSVSRDCSIWQEFLTELGVDFELVPPKNNKTKMDAAYFKKLTGWTGQTNQHGRDASMLCYGY